MGSTLKYKLGLKGPSGSSFQSIERFLKMSKPQKPMKPWPQKPMKPWPQKPMKPWPQKPMKPWKPITEPPVVSTTPTPPPPSSTTTTTRTTTTTTTTPPTVPSTTPSTTTAATIDIDISVTEDYFPWLIPSPLEDIDLPEEGAPVLLKPERAAGGSGALQYVAAPRLYFRQPFQPFHTPVFNYRPYV